MQEEYLVEHKVVLKTDEELKEAIKNAWSIGAYNQPIKPEYIGSNAYGGNVYHYYQDIDGRYYFDDEITLRFDKEIRELQKKRKQSKKISH